MQCIQHHHHYVINPLLPANYSTYTKHRHILPTVAQNAKTQEKGYHRTNSDNKYIRTSNEWQHYVEK